ncbi:hypothetical protein ACIBJE_22855 [Micromonospora sp. NPDC050187]|uniref:hypothetical protein n=1 Tax=Micromonospora sp. NPDC050187 TaxID=3364277 RepID=UPI0037918EB2
MRNRARIIAADGEYQAAAKLAQSAATMDADPAALQLRLLQMVVEVAAEKNSALVMPFPVELLRFLDRATPTPCAPAPVVATRPRAPETATMPDVRRILPESEPTTAAVPVG